MILRNPSLRRDFLFIACSFLFIFFSTTLPAQGINGTVREMNSFNPVAGATITIMYGDSVLGKLETDTEGAFRFSTTRAERVRVLVFAEAYELFVS
ncbi:MAG: hypothetical protein ABIQ11_03450, partial [Saprospiraceae bacterium]